MAASSSSSTGGAASAPPQPPLPPPAPKKSFIRRVIPFFLVTNLAVGVYVLLRTSQNQSDKKDAAAVDIPAAPAESKAVVTPSAVTPVAAPAKELPPIPEAEQRQLLKWILEEKRKVKPTDPSEKKKIDEEKALLKQLISSKSLPSL